MNKNIDLTKILKNCPKGTEFWSIGQGTVVFLGIDRRRTFPIICDRNAFTKEGYEFNDNECVLVPSREQQDLRKFEASWYKNDKKNGKFDPHTLQPFDRVLVRQSKFDVWLCDHFSFVNDYEVCMFSCASYNWNCCIPYNDETKHLVGTDEEAPEYYICWEY